MLFMLSMVFLNSCKGPSVQIEEVAFESDYKFASQIEGELERDTMPWKYQISATDYSMKGDHAAALDHWDRTVGGRAIEYSENEIDSINRKYQKVGAAEFIVKEAKSHRVVIINEAHHNAFHRVFTRSLLRELYQIGYVNLGLEALGNGDHQDMDLNERGHALQSSGYYTSNPQFGNLIRDAIAIGYNVFSYESTEPGSGSPREIAQAANITSMMEERPDEKFLIHCGFDHALEGKHSSWGMAMAGRLSEYTGVDPLTINQVIYSERGNSDLNLPLLKALNVDEPTVILDSLQRPFRYERGEAWCDVAVFHPNTNYIAGRPDWIFSDGYKRIRVPLEELDVTFPAMVMAFPEDEGFVKSVPVAMMEVEGRSDSCFLGLFEGEYVVVVTDGTKAVKFEQSVQ